MSSNRAYHADAAGDAAKTNSGRGPLSESDDQDVEETRPEPVPLPDDEFKDQLALVIPQKSRAANPYSQRQLPG